MSDINRALKWTLIEPYLSQASLSLQQLSIGSSIKETHGIFSKPSVEIAHFLLKYKGITLKALSRFLSNAICLLQKKVGAQKWVRLYFPTCLIYSLIWSQNVQNLFTFLQNIGVLKGREERNGWMVEYGAYIYLICIPAEKIFTNLLAF